MKPNTDISEDAITPVQKLISILKALQNSVQTIVSSVIGSVDCFILLD